MIDIQQHLTTIGISTPIFFLLCIGAWSGAVFYAGWVGGYAAGWLSAMTARAVRCAFGRSS